MAANDNADEAMLKSFVEGSIIRRFAQNVSELRFGKNIKICKRGAFRDRPAGWHLLVEGPVGGHIMKASDRFLYSTQGKDVDPFNDPAFVFPSVVDAIEMAVALEENLGEEGRVVDPSRAFISRFLNPVTFERQASYWASEECGVGAVMAR
jgi:hypothetical protein